MSRAVWLLLLLSSGDGLQIVTPSGSTENRPLTLYQAPRPYRDGRPLNSVIITSKPINLSKSEENSNNDINQYKSFQSSVTPPPEHIMQMDCVAGKPCSTTVEISTIKPTYKQYPPHLLEQLLKEYASVRTASPHETDRHDEMMDHEPKTSTSRLASLVLDDRTEPTNNNDDAVEMDPEGKEERWSLISRPHKHPYDNHKGWVTLDPVPWSSTKIAKWQSTTSNSQRPLIETERPWHNKPSSWYDKIETSPYDRPYDRPADRPSDRPYDRPYDRPFDRPSNWYDKPEPQAQFQQQRPHWADKPTRPNWVDNHPEIEYPYDMKPIQKPRPDCNEIVADYPERPSYNRYPYQPYPHQSQSHPPTYPMMSDGQWVLLSSTKGYSLPQARSLDIIPGSVSTKRTRGIKLTVLPSLKGNGNITTSYGGLLEVESSSQTIDEAQKEWEKNQSNHQGVHQVQQQEVHHRPHTFTAETSKMETDRRTAMLAAVGAGILPATMAMVVPLMLGRRKKREVLNYPEKVELQSRHYNHEDFLEESSRRLPWDDGCRVKLPQQQHHQQQQQQQQYGYHYQRDSSPSIKRLLINMGTNEK